MYPMAIVGLLFRVLLLAEGLGVGKVAGAAAILLGIYLTRREPLYRDEAHPGRIRIFPPASAATVRP